LSELVGSVIEARELQVDVLLQKRAESLIGNIAVGQEIQVETVYEFDIESNLPSNLSEALEFARNGDRLAREMIRSNVATDYFERAYKSGFISEVMLKKRTDGEIEQYGQSIEDVHINSLRFIDNEKLKARAKIEALNSVRDKYYANSGLLNDNARVVFSMVHDGMSDEEAEDVGFFVHTRSVSIQVMTEREDGELVVQSAFVAGRENLSGEAFDKQAIVNLAQKLGVDYSDESSEDILSRPLIIPKTKIPQLAVSVAKLYDEAAGEVTGKQKFFGLNSDQKIGMSEYLSKLQQSHKISEDMSKDIEQVVDKLVLFNATNPTEATAKLAEYNDELLKSRIVVDKSIDSRVLGEKASWHVEHARALLRTDQPIDLNLQRNLMILQSKINQAGNSSSCPNGARTNSLNPDNVFDLNSQQDDNESESSVTEDCEFVSKQCPKCGEKNVKTECRKGKYYGACGCVSD
jgi:hypothetical protein